jgi:hypothetical protein
VAIFRNIIMNQEDNHDPYPTLEEKAKAVSGQVKEGLDRAREGDMPLGIISSLTTEAPLPALAIAFLLGILIARRR